MTHLSPQPSELCHGLHLYSFVCFWPANPTPNTHRSPPAYLAGWWWCLELVNVLGDEPCVHVAVLEGVVVENQLVEGTRGGHTRDDRLIQGTQHTRDGLRGLCVWGRGG